MFKVYSLIIRLKKERTFELRDYSRLPESAVVVLLWYAAIMFEAVLQIRRGHRDSLLI